MSPVADWFGFALVVLGAVAAWVAAVGTGIILWRERRT
jgi:hypothetical protein